MLQQKTKIKRMKADSVSLSVLTHYFRGIHGRDGRGSGGGRDGKEKRGRRRRTNVGEKAS